MLHFIKLRDNGLVKHTIIKMSVDTLRAYLMKNKLGKYSEKPEDLEVKPANDSSTVDGIVVGNRCEVSVPGQPTKRGEVKFVGL